MKPKSLLTIAVVLLFVAFLAWSTLSAQKVTCTVCVDFNGGHNCATASHENEIEALRSAQSTACGPLAWGMHDTIDCGNRPAASRRCATK
jgi:hypothetical protein